MKRATGIPGDKYQYYLPRELYTGSSADTYVSIRFKVCIGVNYLIIHAIMYLFPFLGVSKQSRYYLSLLCLYFLTSDTYAQQ